MSPFVPCHIAGLQKFATLSYDEDQPPRQMNVISLFSTVYTRKRRGSVTSTANQGNWELLRAASWTSIIVWYLDQLLNASGKLLT